MRWTAALLAIVLLHTSRSAYSQITLRAKHATLESILKDVERQTKYVFLYDPDDLPATPISIAVTNATLQETLGKCLRDLPIAFTVIGDNVLLKRTAAVTGPLTGSLSIHGKVTDGDGLPLQGVTILNKRGMKSAQTDSAGDYMIQGVKGDPSALASSGISRV
ncbi:carboxypeptidase-like regulatory domain-containing protein [Puia sp. P3]|uniref:carboxypeptidase-like regulatory domain-containing protein n=1 Tax=Puia sp. P3 TaxID=3423952 RepID=UPI003D678B9B